MKNLLADIELPPGTRWIDKLSYSPVRLVADRTVSGSMVYSVQQLIGGRPITLEFKATDWPLLTINDVMRMQNHAAVPGATLVLQWDGVDYLVMFDHTRGAFDFSPLIGLKNEADDSYLGKVFLLGL